MSMAWKAPIRRATTPPVKSPDPQATAAHKAKRAVKNVVPISLPFLFVYHLVMLCDHPGTKRLRIHEFQCIDAHMLENARPCPESKWKHEKVKLIHQASFQHRVRQLAHAILQQALTWRLLELPDL